MELSEEQYRNRKQEVISKFRKEFIDGCYLYDAELHAVVEMLIRDADPYTIIEQLIINRIEYEKRLKKILMESNLYVKRVH